MQSVSLHQTCSRFVFKGLMTVTMAESSFDSARAASRYAWGQGFTLERALNVPFVQYFKKLEDAKGYAEQLNLRKYYCEKHQPGYCILLPGGSESDTYVMKGNVRNEFELSS